MEEEIYTKNEKELLKLTKFFVEYFSDIPTLNEEDKKAKVDSLNYYQQIEKDIIHFANERYKEIQAADGGEIKKWENYYDVECPHCRFYAALKPIGEEKAANGYTYFNFDCPKCETKFHDTLPNTDIEKINYTKFLYDYFIAKGEDGRINHVRLQIPKDKVNGFLDMHLKLKEAFEELGKSLANDKVRHQGFAEMVANEIIELTTFKQQLLSGGMDNRNGDGLVN